MENVAERHQKLNSLSPSWISKNNSPVGQSSYVHTKGKHSHIATLNSIQRKDVEKGKSKSERAKIKYQTRDKLVRLLSEVGQDSTAESMARCGEFSDVLTCGQHIVAETFNHRCNIRFCVLCANRRASRYRRKYLPYAKDFLKPAVLKQYDEFKHLASIALTPCLLTLTQIKIKGEKYADSRNRLLKSFRQIVRHKSFKKFFAGGLFTVENVSTDGNHTHLHIVIFRKKFVDLEDLKASWAFVSDGAKNLNIRLIGKGDDELESGLRECIKYISKPLDMQNFTKENLLELLEVKGKRMIDTFGEFRKFCQVHEPEEELKEEKQKLEEGNCCFHCNDDSVLFHVRMTKEQRIEFENHLELTRGSPPTLIH